MDWLTDPRWNGVSAIVSSIGLMLYIIERRDVFLTPIIKHSFSKLIISVLVLFMGGTVGYVACIISYLLPFYLIPTIRDWPQVSEKFLQYYPLVITTLIQSSAPCVLAAMTTKNEDVSRARAISASLLTGLVWVVYQVLTGTLQLEIPSINETSIVPRNIPLWIPYILLGLYLFSGTMLNIMTLTGLGYFSYYGVAISRKLLSKFAQAEI